MAHSDTPNTQIIGEAPSFLAMLERVSSAAPLSKPVLLIGERGTGKELIGARLHYLSGRWDQPLVKVNCAALTETLLESELFGHEAGSFTGATRRHVGRFERAHEGTLFLDELATVPLRMQEKILRAIEYGEFERVGGSETISADVRIVGATNEDLPALADEGRFRRDLLDRLAFDVITVPPLRARPEDIITLAQHFAVNVSSELGRSFFAGFSEHARRILLSHAWPGNVRELKNVVERSVYRGGDSDEPLQEINLDPFASPWRPRPETSVVRARQRAPAVEELPSSPGPDAESSGAAADDLSRHPVAGASLDWPLDLRAQVAELEVALAGAALQRARFNQRRAAEMLGLGYHQLRRLIAHHAALGEQLRERRQ